MSSSGACIARGGAATTSSPPTPRASARSGRASATRPRRRPNDLPRAWALVRGRSLAPRDHPRALRRRVRARAQGSTGDLDTDEDALRNMKVPDAFDATPPDARSPGMRHRPPPRRRHPRLPPRPLGRGRPLLPRVPHLSTISASAGPLQPLPRHPRHHVRVRPVQHGQGESPWPSSPWPRTGMVRRHHRIPPERLLLRLRRLAAPRRIPRHAFRRRANASRRRLPLVRATSPSFVADDVALFFSSARRTRQESPRPPRRTSSRDPSRRRNEAEQWRSCSTVQHRVVLGSLRRSSSRRSDGEACRRVRGLGVAWTAWVGLGIYPRGARAGTRKGLVGKEPRSKV